MDRPPGLPGLTAAPEVSEVQVRPRTQPVAAWRYWQLVPASLRLQSVSHRFVSWEPGRPLRAACVAGRHPSPAERCNCGVYGAPDLETLRRGCLCLRPGGVVVGQVALWGRVMADADGFRAELAYPKSLSLVHETVEVEARPQVLEALSEYGVDVETVSLGEAVGDVSAALLAHQAMAARTGGP